MRQVPAKKFLIIGNGRTAMHMTHYLGTLGHTLEHWHYRTGTSSHLQEKASNSDFILLLIRDSAIKGFLDSHPYLLNKKTIHFSGALDIDGIQNVHPLMSFSVELMSQEAYRRIPFAYFDELATTLDAILPGLPNPGFYVPRKSKALYHGLCVASGNLMVLLWQTTAREFDRDFAIPTPLLVPYLESITHNLKTNWENALTGPIARRDEVTLLKNYQALRESPLGEIFEAHVKLAWPEFATKHFHSNLSKGHLLI